MENHPGDQRNCHVRHLSPSALCRDRACRTPRAGRRDGREAVAGRVARLCLRRRCDGGPAIDRDDRGRPGLSRRLCVGWHWAGAGRRRMAVSNGQGRCRRASLRGHVQPRFRVGEGWKTSGALRRPRECYRRKSCHRNQWLLRAADVAGATARGRQAGPASRSFATSSWCCPIVDRRRSSRAATAAQAPRTRLTIAAASAAFAVTADQSWRRIRSRGATHEPPRASTSDSRR